MSFFSSLSPSFLLEKRFLDLQKRLFIDFNGLILYYLFLTRK